ncbi:MAG: PhaM family polyhydroxyalkanoate granule multifunctional regulatory protein, partial [Betaproteobacteria bacterium]
MAEDSSRELFEYFQKMWNPMSFPIPGMFQPTMDVEEIEKKIRELQAVENWLKMNLTFVQMTGKTLEMQKSALETIQESAKQNLVVNFKGNSKVQQNEDWPLLQRDWNEALQAEATRAGYGLTEAQTSSSNTKDGVGITINVSNFRYLTTGSRVAAGIMVGNAWVNSSADFSDLKSG